MNKTTKTSAWVAASWVALLAMGCGGSDDGANAPPPPTPAPASTDMPVFLLAGQSNMEGNVDPALFRKLLTELTPAPSPGVEQRLVGHIRDWLFSVGASPGNGYSESMTTFVASEMVRLRTEDLIGSALSQPHPKVMCSMNVAAIAPMATNCGSAFGPELMFGHMVARTLPTPTSMIKVAKGGTTLKSDWRSASRGEPLGEQYRQLSARIASLKLAPASVHPDCATRKCEWAAFVYFQGENDTFDPAGAAAYEANLRLLIADVRKEVGNPNLPVVVVQIGAWALSMPHGRAVGQAQVNVATSDPRARLVTTSDLGLYYHYDPAGQLVIGERVAKAVQELLAARL